jgi:hypothetical protein
VAFRSKEERTSARSSCIHLLLLRYHWHHLEIIGKLGRVSTGHATTSAADNTRSHVKESQPGESNVTTKSESSSAVPRTSYPPSGYSFVHQQATAKGLASTQISPDRETFKTNPPRILRKGQEPLDHLFEAPREKKGKGRAKVEDPPPRLSTPSPATRSSTSTGLVLNQSSTSKKGKGNVEPISDRFPSPPKGNASKSPPSPTSTP